jgi:cytochrome d ubiquinol oxidase subunit I
LWRGRLFESRAVLWALMLAMPFPYIANHAGWVVAEVGRQPWIVYGLQRSADATSQNVTAGMTLFTLLGFMGLYALVGLLYLLLVLRTVHAGPGGAHGDESPGPIGTGASMGGGGSETGKAHP